MKKIFIFILSVLVITSFVLNIECQDVLVKIRRIDTKKASTVSKKSITEKKNNIKENNVRIVLKDNSVLPIYVSKEKVLFNSDKYLNDVKEANDILKELEKRLHI